MPAEAIRLQRRLGARDRWFIALLALAVVIGSASALVVSHERDASRADARCIEFIRASWMGGATFTYCGDEAAAFCRQAGSSEAEIAAECKRAGLARAG
jgi:hypothetical protein